jgi:mannose-6-phosphate isomerase-like protein (cupin superfamily)
MKSLTEVKQGDEIYAIVLRRDFRRPGPNFFTPGEFSQQLGLLVHPKGRVVKRHRHKLVKREIFRTQEVLVLLDGRIRVELFDEEGGKLRTVILKPGDSILLARGGHRVTVLDDARIIEVKQGPYAGFDDKEFF